MPGRHDFTKLNQLVSFRFMQTNSLHPLRPDSIKEATNINYGKQASHVITW
jgi:hypothetical protein